MSTIHDSNHLEQLCQPSCRMWTRRRCCCYRSGRPSRTASGMRPLCRTAQALVGQMPRCVPLETSSNCHAHPNPIQVRHFLIMLFLVFEHILWLYTRTSSCLFMMLMAALVIRNTQVQVSQSSAALLVVRPTSVTNTRCTVSETPSACTKWRTDFLRQTGKLVTACFCSMPICRVPYNVP